MASGQVLESTMFSTVEVTPSAVPANATTDIASTVASFEICTDKGLSIGTNLAEIITSNSASTQTPAQA